MNEQDKKFIDNNRKLRNMPNNGDCLICGGFVVWGAGTTGGDGRVHFRCTRGITRALLNQEFAAERHFVNLGGGL